MNLKIVHKLVSRKLQLQLLYRKIGNDRALFCSYKYTFLQLKKQILWVVDCVLFLTRNIVVVPVIIIIIINMTQKG